MTGVSGQCRDRIVELDRGKLASFPAFFRLSGAQGTHVV